MCPRICKFAKKSGQSPNVVNGDFNVEVEEGRPGLEYTLAAHELRGFIEDEVHEVRLMFVSLELFQKLRVDLVDVELEALRFA